MDFLNLKLTWKSEANLSPDANEDELKEYKNTLIECHRDNKSFNDKVISTFCAAAIPFLLTLSKDLDFTNGTVFSLFNITLILFTIILLVQILNALLAIKGCEHGLEKKYDISYWVFDKTDKIEIGIILAFFGAILLTFATFYVNFNIKGVELKKQVKVQINQDSSTPITATFEYTIPSTRISPVIKREKGNKMSKQNDFIKSVKDAGTPNKSIRPNPNPPKESNPKK